MTPEKPRLDVKIKKMTLIPEIKVQNCQECGKDNWTYPLIEIVCKHSKKSFWLCRDCALELRDLITEMIK